MEGGGGGVHMTLLYEHIHVLVHCTGYMIVQTHCTLYTVHSHMYIQS